MKKRGRKPAEIDWKRADDLLIAGCKGTEIAAHFGIHADTLYRHCETENKVGFTAYSQQKRAIGDGMIHVAQFELAVRKRNVTMLIWLGKVRLGQSEKVTLEHQGAVPIQVVSYNGRELKPWKDEK